MVHPDALTFAIRELMARHPACRECVCGEVLERPPDARGCNWTLSVVSGRGGGDCLLAMLPTLRLLQQRFAIGDRARCDTAPPVDLQELLSVSTDESPDD